MKTKLTLFLAFIFAFINTSIAQNGNVIEQTFHESGKINVVLSVVLIIFIGIIFYLVRLERKISKVEKETEK